MTNTYDGTGLDVAVLMTCFNRRETTRKCLTVLEHEFSEASVQYTVYLTDDGSSDGTGEMVNMRFPNVQVIQGGDLYWAAGMARSEQLMRQHTGDGKHSHVLWLNDDVVLFQGALSRLLKLASEFEGAIIAAATQATRVDAVEITYSGFVRRRGHPLNFSLVVPTEHPQSIDTFNGNIVLVPDAVARALRSIDGEYSHALADLDYGLRAKKCGFDVILAPDTYGSCDRNIEYRPTSLRVAWKKLTDEKGSANPKSTARFMRRHGGRTWFLYFISTYLAWLTRQFGGYIVHRRDVRIPAH